MSVTVIHVVSLSFLSLSSDCATSLSFSCSVDKRVECETNIIIIASFSHISLFIVVVCQRAWGNSSMLADAAAAGEAMSALDVAQCA